jgi:hypothetical protein
MEKRSERVRLAAAKGGDELQNPVACAAGQARQHVLQQRLQTVRQIRRAEELLRVTIDGGDVFVAVGQWPQVEGKDVFGEIRGQNTRVQDDRFNPGFDGGSAHKDDVRQLRHF